MNEYIYFYKQKWKHTKLIQFNHQWLNTNSLEQCLHFRTVSSINNKLVCKQKNHIICVFSRNITRSETRTGTKFWSKQRQCYHSQFSSRSPPFSIRRKKTNQPKTWLEQNMSALDISWEETPRSFWCRCLSETPSKKMKKRLKEETNLEATMEVSMCSMLWLPWLFFWPLGFSESQTDSWNLLFEWYLLSLLWLLSFFFLAGTYYDHTHWAFIIIHGLYYCTILFCLIHGSIH